MLESAESRIRLQATLDNNKLRNLALSSQVRDLLNPFADLSFKMGSVTQDVKDLPPGQQTPAGLSVMAEGGFVLPGLRNTAESILDKGIKDGSITFDQSDPTALKTQLISIMTRLLMEDPELITQGLDEIQQTNIAR